MDKFLERHKLTKLTQEEIHNLNSTKKTELVIFKFPTKKAKAQMVSLVNSTKHLKNLKN